MQSRTPLQATTTSQRIPFSQTNLVPCANGGAGELVEISGTLHTVSGTTVDQAGGIHLHVHIQPQNATGTGLTTGDTYQPTAVAHQNFNVNAGGLPFSATFVNSFRLIGPGPGNNLQVHQLIHTTVNENGSTTVTINASSVTCG